MVDTVTMRARTDPADLLFGILFLILAPFMEMIAAGNGKENRLYEEMIAAERAARKLMG